jgi:hypothetical protein
MARDLGTLLASRTETRTNFLQSKRASILWWPSTDTARHAIQRTRTKFNYQLFDIRSPALHTPCGSTRTLV